MKKKLYSALTITLLAVALLVFVSRDAGEVVVKDTETISQESDKETPQDTEGVLWGGLEDAIEQAESSNQVAKGENKGPSNSKPEEAEESDDVMDYKEPASEATVNKLLGNDLSHEKSVTSNSGVVIPVLNKFNVAALDPECEDSNGMQDWFGYVGEESAPGYVNANACGVAMSELTEAMNISGGFLPQQDHISFSFTDVYASTGDLELRRDFDNGYYTIGINYDMSDEEAFYSVEDGKDALILLCSVVSSEPSELAEFLYEESFVVEECMTSEDSWVTVGDCQVQWGGYQGNELDELVYRVKAKL